jgi:hypothetical protein
MVADLGRNGGVKSEPNRHDMLLSVQLILQVILWPVVSLNVASLLRIPLITSSEFILVLPLLSSQHSYYKFVSSQL